MHLGCHLSIAKGFESAVNEAISIGANTFQFFTRNPRGGSARAADPGDYESAATLMKIHNFGPLLAHAPYTMNLAAADPKVFDFAKRSIKEDLDRMEAFPATLYNFHPGSHVGQGIERGIELISEVINGALTGRETTTLLLEAMSGKGSEVGYTFEQLREIIDRIDHQEKMGVCLDTCHIFSAGYDYVTDLDDVLDHFDRIVGLNRLKAIHLNDSMTPFNARKDRHEKLGEGLIGLEPLIRFIEHPAIRSLPILLETPNEIEGYAKEIALIKGRFGL
jgi:deoxyribonuclease-4